jgi:hypothetical protein
MRSRQHRRRKFTLDNLDEGQKAVAVILFVGSVIMLGLVVWLA